MLGLSRVGSIAGHTSGDLLLTFANAPENRVDRLDESPLQARVQVNDGQLNPFFRATVEATAEAVLNAMVAAETMVGRDGNMVYALPHDRLREIMRAHGRVSNEQ
jgi:L-aminopeptidase/D-esterase-like protein